MALAADIIGGYGFSLLKSTLQVPFKEDKDDTVLTVYFTRGAV